MHASFVDVIRDGANQVAHGAAPIALARTAMEITRAIVHGGADFVRVAGAMEGDMEEEIAKPASQPQGPAEPRHELAFVGGLEQNVTRIELDHKQ